MEIRRNQWFSWGAIRWAVVFFGLLHAGWMAAQPRRSSPAPAATSSPVNSQDVAGTRLQLLKLLRMSPKMTTVVARDSSLLTDREYVARNNPELAQFLENHPEITRNPEFYLFAEPGEGNGQLESAQRKLLMERAVWPELSERERQEIRWSSNQRTGDLIPFVAFVMMLATLLWLLRVFLQNRRWSQLFKAQTESYNKLLDKFGNNEELLAYVRSDAGKRLLESASIPLSADPTSHAGGLANRLLGSLQLGIVLTLVGIGLMALRNHVPDGVPLLIFGTLALTLGLGFIISAGVSFGLGRHLKLLPQSNQAQPENHTWTPPKGQQ
jgi:hypothetical protein